MQTTFTFNIGRAFPATNKPGRDVTCVTIGSISSKDYREHYDPLQATGLEINDFIRLYDAKTLEPITLDLEEGSEVEVLDLRVNPARKPLPNRKGYEKRQTLFLSALVDAASLSYETDVPYDDDDDEEEEAPRRRTTRRTR